MADILSYSWANKQIKFIDANENRWWHSYIKGTISVISSDPACKYGIVRLTTVPLKALSDQI